VDIISIIDNCQDRFKICGCFIIGPRAQTENFKKMRPIKAAGMVGGIGGKAKVHFQVC